MSRLAGRVPLPRLLGVGLGGALAAASVLAVVLALSDGSAVLVWACLFVMVFSFGIGIPALITITQDLGRDAPGATSGLVGASQFMFGAAAAPVTGLFGTTSALPMAVVMVCGLGLAVVGLRAARLGSGQPGVAV